MTAIHVTPTTDASSTTHVSSADAAASSRYLQPGWITRHVFNRAMRRMTRMGISVRGSRELRIQGRTTGTWHAVPVNPLTIGDDRYLVAPRGTTHWVRNLRAAGHGELVLGRKVEVFTATELADDVKPEILREYLRRWKAEVGVFFDGVGPTATDAELASIASGYPVFRVNSPSGR